MCQRLLDWLWDLQGLTCREAMRLAAKAMDAPLRLRERAALRLHNVLCHCCRDYAWQIRLLRRWLRRMARIDAPISARLPRDRAQRIKDALRKA
jgi:hypothetical protein